MARLPPPPTCAHCGIQSSGAKAGVCPQCARKHRVGANSRPHLDLVKVEVEYFVRPEAFIGRARAFSKGRSHEGEPLNVDVQGFLLFTKLAPTDVPISLCSFCRQTVWALDAGICPTCGPIWRMEAIEVDIVRFGEGTRHYKLQNVPQVIIDFSTSLNIPPDKLISLEWAAGQAKNNPENSK